jgi:hypothetical protein
MERTCKSHVEKRDACRILVGKPEGKRPLGKPKRRWILERDRVGWYELDPSASGSEPVEGSCEHGTDSIKYWEILSS